MKRIVLALVMALMVTSAAFAITPVPTLTVKSSEISSFDKNNVYVEGSVSIAEGQKVVVKRDGVVIGGQNLTSSNFKIKIPAAYVSQGAKFAVKSMKLKGKVNASAEKIVTVVIKPAPVVKAKQNQSIAASAKSVLVGGSVALGAKASSGLKVSYKSSNPNVATVDANGKVVGKAGGKVTITIAQGGDANYNQTSKTIVVTVNKVNQSVTASNKTVKMGSTANLGAKASSGLGVTYRSSNTKIATVDKSGKVTPKKAGSAKITIKQAGNSKYNAAAKTVTVTVQDATYTIKYNANGGTGTMKSSTAKINKAFTLSKNTFKKEGYEFVGWCDASGKQVMKGTDVTKFKNVNMNRFQLGKVKYKNKASVKNLAKANKTITLYAVWKGKGVIAAADWAKLIAADNEFHYGKNPYSHNRGCFYCGDQYKKKGHMKNYAKSYCCNAFVSACYTHGGNMFSHCRNYGWIDAGRCRSGRDTAFKPIGKPSKSKLKKGDLFCHRNGHVSIYVGNGKYASAENGDNDVKYSRSWNISILVTELSGARWSGSGHCVDTVCRPR